MVAMKNDRKDDDVGGMLRRRADCLEAFPLYRKMEYVIAEAFPQYVAARTAGDRIRRREIRAVPSKVTLAIA